MPPASTSSCATSRSPAGSSPPSSSRRTRSPSSASWPRRPTRTSSSCRTSAPRSRSSRRRSRSCRTRATTCPSTRTRARPTTPSRAARSTRCCARGTPTAARPPPSSSSRATTRTRWARGRRTPRRTWRRCARATSARPRRRSRSSADDELRIEHLAADGTVTVLRDGIAVLEGEIVDAAVMRRAALDAFLAEQVADAKAQGVLFSVHLKATMMKVSDPIIFGHAVRAYFKDAVRRAPDLDPNNGLASLPDEVQRRDRARRTRPARRSRWSTPTAASPTCTSRAT